MEQFLMQYLVNSIWQVSLLAAGAWIILRVSRPGPIVQHRVWIGALALMLSIPLVTLRASTAAPIIPAATPSATKLSAAVPANIPTIPSVSRIEVPPPAALIPALQPVPSPLSTPKALSSLPQAYDLKLAPSATHWFAGLYLAITVFMALRLLSSWWLALRIVARAMPAELNGPASALLGQCCERLGVDRPNVLVSTKTSSPMLVGVLRPSLLLPEDFAAQFDKPIITPNQDLEAVWLHELVHLRRRDYLANFVCHIAALPIAYHPVTFAVQRRIRQTREMVCDAVAAAEMESPAGYARCLVSLAHNMNGTAARIEGVGILDGGILEERIVQLINRKSATTTRMQITRLAAGAAMSLAVLAASTILHLTPTMAQTAIPTPLQAVIIAPTAPIAAMAPSQVPAQSQPATPAKSAASAKQATAVNQPSGVESGPASLDNARKQYDEALAAYNSLLAAANAKRESGDPNFNQQLPQAKKRLDEAQRAYDNLLHQRALLGEKLLNEEHSNQAAQTQQLAILSAMLAQTTARFNSPEFRSKMELLNDAELKSRMEALNSMNQQLEDAAAKLNSSEFRKQMQTLNALELKKQMEWPAEQMKELNNEMADVNDMALAKIQMEKMNSPEFKKQLAEAQAKISSPEFRERLQNLSKQIAEAQTKFAATPEMRMRNDALGDEFNKQMDEVRSLIDQALKAWDATESAPTAPPQ